MKRRNSLVFCILACSIAVALFSCSEKRKPKKPIVLGDTSLIVTETDSQYLLNTTNDISTKSKKSSESQITKMMVQVDSVNTSKKLNAEETTPQKLSGFTINFAECTVVFEGILAHALNASQNERASESVSYLKDAGQFLETMLEIEGLSETRVEQRLFVKLGLELDNEVLILNDLGKFITQWYPLAGKGNKFVSVSANSLLFDPVDARKIKNALESELRKKKKKPDEIQKWKSGIAQTKSYTDAPCKLLTSSSQWRIIGKKDGKTVRKLIQFDNP